MAHKSAYITDEALQPLASWVITGWNDDLEEQLIDKSRQENILRRAPKDAAERFRNHESAKAWLAKGREVHWLVGVGDDLAGVIWYGPAVPPHPFDANGTQPETYAIRLYDGYVGRGLANPFMLQSLRVLCQERKETGRPIPFIWLETDIDNAPAVAAYTKFGYKEYARDEKRVSMLLTPDRIREILDSHQIK